MAPLLKIDALTVRYGAVEAVRGIDITVEEGEIVALLGANGAGKSSTMNAVMGLAPTSSGAVTFEDERITGLTSENIVTKGLTLSPEGRRVFGTLNVADNLMMGAYTVADPAKIAAAYERVFALFPILKERRNQYAGTLSGGQQQMLAVGRALMSNPRLLLLDEPSLGLAPRIVEQVFELIEQLRDQGVALLLVEQNAPKALEIADRGYVMAGGRIISSGSAAQLAGSETLADAYLGAE